MENFNAKSRIFAAQRPEPWSVQPQSRSMLAGADLESRVLMIQ